MALIGDLVALQSGTTVIAGLDAVRARLIPEFEALDMTASIVSLAGNRKVLSFETAGHTPRIAFIGHLDTVFNDPSQAHDAVLSGEGPEQILHGPGVIDMKGGIALLLQVLHDLSPEERSAVRVILNDDEETGSNASKEALRNLIYGMDAALIFEPGLPDGGVVTAHSGVRWLGMKVNGKAAHAGLEPQNGLSACVELGHKLVALGQISDFARQLTVNPGVINGGTAPNVVCAEASIKIDIRYVREADLTEALDSIEAIRAKSYTRSETLGLETTAEVTQLAALPPMPFEATTVVFQRAKKAAQSFNLDLAGWPVGYASDGNHLASLGVPLLVGLGPYGGKMHTDEEFMLVKSFEERRMVVGQLVRDLLDGDMQ
jgi:glutamate carboxypeptidase